jgi:aryl-phospho-beta-D-glucosidase BglC (GH1 family)
MTFHTTVDLHDGAPGSQNGYDNLGQRTSSPQCALQSENVDATLAIIQVIASELGPVVDAIELPNEVVSFYGKAWVGHRRARVLEERIRGREANGGR